MLRSYSIKIFLITFLSTQLFAELSIQERIYDAAEEMIRFDEKMNQAIREHNQINDEDEMDLETMQVNDFLETPNGYLLEQEIENYEETEVNVEIQNDLLVISTKTVDKDFFTTELNSTETTILSSLSVSLLIPHNADKGKMQKSYSNGLLTIIFPYKNK